MHIAYQSTKGKKHHIDIGIALKDLHNNICNSFEVIRKTTEIVASGDADTQWRRIRKSTEPRAEHLLRRMFGGFAIHRRMSI